MTTYKQIFKFALTPLLVFELVLCIQNGLCLKWMTILNTTLRFLIKLIFQFTEELFPFADFLFHQKAYYKCIINEFQGESQKQVECSRGIFPINSYPLQGLNNNSSSNNNNLSQQQCARCLAGEPVKILFGFRDQSI